MEAIAYTFTIRKMTFCINPGRFWPPWESKLHTATLSVSLHTEPSSLAVMKPVVYCSRGHCVYHVNESIHTFLPSMVSVKKKQTKEKSKTFIFLTGLLTLLLLAVVETG